MTRLRVIPLVVLGVFCIAGTAFASLLGEARFRRWSTSAEFVAQTAVPVGVVGAFADDTGALWLYTGAEWRQLYSATGSGAFYRTSETSTGGSFVNTVSDTVSIHICNSSSAYTLNLPTHAVGREIRIINKGAGVVTLQAVVAVGQVNSTAGLIGITWYEHVDSN
jgi:hypothetical protein